MTILVCGEALFDFFQTPVGEKDGAAAPGALSFEARVGGSPFNVAIGIARLRGRASLLTGISTDMLGKRLIQRLRAEGVGTDHVVRTGRRTTLSLVGLDAAGSPEYAFYGIGSADCALRGADMPAPGPDITALHFGSYSVAVPPVADAFAAFAAAHRDRFISLDPNVRPTIEPDMAIWRARVDALRAYADLIKVSAEDLSMMYPGADPHGIARSWLTGPTALVIVTDGGNDVHAFRTGEQISVAPPETDVIDTVGAGDAFQACVLAGLQARGAMAAGRQALPGAELQALLHRAARAAAAVCARRGADMARPEDL